MMIAFCGLQQFVRVAIVRDADYRQLKDGFLSGEGAERRAFTVARCGLSPAHYNIATTSRRAGETLEVVLDIQAVPKPQQTLGLP
jgi:hypothetical protein